MCFALAPVLAAISTAATTAAPIAGVVGAGLSIAGGLSAAQGARAAASYNAQAAAIEGQAAQAQAEYSARVAEGEAAQARQAATFEEERRRERARFLMGDQRQRFLVSGIGLEGSPLEVLAFNAGQYELDALAARYEGGVRAQSLETEAESRRFSGRLAGYQAARGAGVALLQGQTAAAGFRQQAALSVASRRTLQDVGGAATTIGGWLT